ncbi:hypothetical protein AAMO2058_000253400 [Amorphochlora amoebiformis]
MAAARKGLVVRLRWAMLGLSLYSIVMYTSNMYSQSRGLSKPVPLTRNAYPSRPAPQKTTPTLSRNFPRAVIKSLIQRPILPSRRNFLGTSSAITVVDSDGTNDKGNDHFLNNDTSEDSDGLSDLFWSIDTDGDGKITIDELKHGLCNLDDNEEVCPIEVETLVKSADLNEDGTLDMDEFRTITARTEAMFSPLRKDLGESNEKVLKVSGSLENPPTEPIQPTGPTISTQSMEPMESTDMSRTLRMPSTQNLGLLFSYTRTLVYPLLDYLDEGGKDKVLQCIEGLQAEAALGKDIIERTKNLARCLSVCRVLAQSKSSADAIVTALLLVSHHYQLAGIKGEEEPKLNATSTNPKSKGLSKTEIASHRVAKYRDTRQSHETTREAEILADVLKRYLDFAGTNRNEVMLLLAQRLFDMRKRVKMLKEKNEEHLARAKLLSSGTSSSSREDESSWLPVERKRKLNINLPDGHDNAVTALEVLQVWAPLAHAVGIKQLVNELETLSFQVLFPNNFGLMANWHSDTTAFYNTALNAAMDTIKRTIKQLKVDAAQLLESRIGELYGNMDNERVNEDISFPHQEIRLVNSSQNEVLVVDEDMYTALMAECQFDVQGRIKQVTSAFKKMFRSYTKTLVKTSQLGVNNSVLIDDEIPTIIAENLLEVNTIPSPQPNPSEKNRPSELRKIWSEDQAVKVPPTLHDLIAIRIILHTPQDFGSTYKAYDILDRVLMTRMGDEIGGGLTLLEELEIRLCEKLYDKLSCLWPGIPGRYKNYVRVWMEFLSFNT